MKINSQMKWLGVFFSAVLVAGCSGEPEGVQEPDTQTMGPLKQALQVAKLHMTAEDGTEADFLLPDGGSVKVTNEQFGIAYRLTGQVIDSEQLIVTVEQFNDIELKSLNSTDVLYLERGRESRDQSAITPFSLRLSGLENDTLRETPQSQVQAQGNASLLTCCVTCSGWTTCCTPTAGHCCKISTACGLGCTVCN